MPIQPCSTPVEREREREREGEGEAEGEREMEREGEWEWEGGTHQQVTTCHQTHGEQSSALQGTRWRYTAPGTPCETPTNICARVGFSLLNVIGISIQFVRPDSTCPGYTYIYIIYIHIYIYMCVCVYIYIHHIYVCIYIVIQQARSISLYFQ